VETTLNALTKALLLRLLNGAVDKGDCPNIYRTTHLDPELTVTVIPLLIVIGPADTALEPLGIV